MSTCPSDESWDLRVYDRGSRPAACPAYRVNFLSSQLVDIVRRRRTLPSRFVKSAKVEKDGKRILDYLIVALIGLAQILAAGADNQILIERQLDLAHCHGGGANQSQREPVFAGYRWADVASEAISSTTYILRRKMSMC